MKQTTSNWALICRDWQPAEEKVQNGDAGTLWRRSAIQHGEGRPIWDASRHGDTQEGTGKLSLTPPPLCLIRAPLCWKGCPAAGIARGGKVCKGKELNLVDSLEEQQGETLASRLHLAKSGRSEPRARECGLPRPRLGEAQPTGRC